MYTFLIANMTCGKCIGAVNRAILEGDHDAQTDFDKDSKTVKITTDLPQDQIIELLTEAGYPPVAQL